MKLRRESLSWQLLWAVLSVYFSITVVVTLIQMGTEYFHTRATIRAELESVEGTFKPALTTALWELNGDQQDAILEGIVALPIISEVRLLDKRGNERYRLDQVRGVGDNLFDGIHHAFRLPHHFSGETFDLGEVIFTASSNVVLDRLILGYQMILVTALIKSTVLAALFIWVFRRRLGEPLEELTREVSSIDLDSLGYKRVNLGQDKENELSQLQRTFNRMLTTLDEERRLNDAALEALNRGLEEDVRRRTEELQQANDRLEQLVRTDALTGAANRRHFHERAEIEFERARRGLSPLSLLAIDLDHFKRINDNYGHAAGDAVLRNFALCVMDLLRATDLLARFGGEEFVVLLPDTDIDGALDVAERVLRTVRGQRVECEAGLISYTASIGAAQFAEGEANCDALVGHADAALYRAKMSGRDRIETS